MIYKIELEAIPEFMFCCSVTAENYKNEFKCPKDFLEISVIEEGRIIAKEPNDAYIIEESSLFVPTSALSVSLSALNGQPQRHTTVGVRVKYRLSEVSREEIKKERFPMKENVIYIPKTKKLDKKTFDRLLLKIKRIASLYHSLDKSSSLCAVSEWFRLCSEITEMTVSKLDNSELSPSAKLYADRVIKYISGHLSERISIKAMALEMGISEGYMQNVFKSVTGKSIIAYANEYKIKTAAEMLKVQNMKLSDISGCVGIDDVAYMSRLFKSIMGVSFQEYKKDLFLTELNSK